jgi:ATP-dependent exoDNAse (exonuclease V) beta subunit
MAILCRQHSGAMCAECLRKRKLPHQLRRNSSSVFDPAHDSIKVMTLHASKGLEYPVVALVGAGRMPLGAKTNAGRCGCFMWGSRGQLFQKPARSVHRFVVWRPTRSTFWADAACLSRSLEPCRYG